MRIMRTDVRIFHGIPIVFLDAAIPAIIWLHDGRPDFFYRGGPPGLFDPFLMVKTIWWLLIFTGISWGNRALKKYQLKYSASQYLVFLLFSAIALLLYYIHVFGIRRIVGFIGMPTVTIVLLYLLIGVIGRLITNRIRLVHKLTNTHYMETSLVANTVILRKKIIPYLSLGITTIVIVALTIILAGISLTRPLNRVYDTQKCKFELDKIRRAMLFYASDNNDTFPSSLKNLSDSTFQKEPLRFACPESDKEYVLVVVGQKRNVPDDTVLVFCPHEHLMHDDGYAPYTDRIGLNVSLREPSTVFDTVLMNEAKKLFKEQGIDYYSQN